MTASAEHGTGTSLSRPVVVPRHRWGADESLRFDSSGREIWPHEADPVRGFVVHHTKTPNGECDSAARLRAVYAFHAVKRGWGDIGYHLIIDELGAVYEGRAGTAEVLDGGPAVVAGHVYGHNRGNVGVALLGTLFDEPPSARAWESLVRLLAWLSHQHDVSLSGTGSDDESSASAISAHCDLGVTTCPGAACYALLPALRAEVAMALDGVARSGAAAQR